MKILVIILGIACAGLAYGLYQSNSSANKQDEAAATHFQSLSNQVAELRTRLALEQGTASHSHSNMLSAIDRRTGEMLNASNRLVQLNLLYRTAQAESRNTQADLQSHAARLAVVEAERADLQRRLAVIAPLENKLTEVKEKLSETAIKQNSLLQEVRQLELERARLSFPRVSHACIRMNSAAV